METKTIEVSAALAKEIERLQDPDFIKDVTPSLLQAFESLNDLHTGGVPKDAGALGYIVSLYYNIFKCVYQ